MTDINLPQVSPSRRKWRLGSLFRRKPNRQAVEVLETETKEDNNKGGSQIGLLPVWDHNQLPNGTRRSFARTEDCFTDSSSLMTDYVEAADDTDSSRSNTSLTEGILVHRLVPVIDKGVQTEESSLSNPASSRSDDVSLLKVFFLPFAFPILILIELLRGFINVCKPIRRRNEPPAPTRPTPTQSTSISRPTPTGNFEALLKILFLPFAFLKLIFYLLRCLNELPAPTRPTPTQSTSTSRPTPTQNPIQGLKGLFSLILLPVMIPIMIINVIFSPLAFLQRAGSGSSANRSAENRAAPQPSKRKSSPFVLRIPTGPPIPNISYKGPKLNTSHLRSRGSHSRPCKCRCKCSVM